MDCLVEGPISYDLAVCKESAETKGYDSPVAGDAAAARPLQRVGHHSIAQQDLAVGAGVRKISLDGRRGPPWLCRGWRWPRLRWRTKPIRVYDDLHRAGSVYDYPGDCAVLRRADPR